MKIRLIWDDCTPTIERRPATGEDIENDIHLVELDSEEDLLNMLGDLVGYDEDDLEDCGDDTREKIECVLSALSDPGDGTPNVLFLSIDGEILQDWLDGVDGLTCSEQDVKDAQINDMDEEPWESEDDFADDDWEDDFDEEDEEGVEESLTEASSAETRAFKNGGEDLDDYIDGKAIARIKDPKDREAAIAAKKAGREDVVKQFTGDRKEDQALASYEKKANKMEDAGTLSEDLDEPIDEAEVENELLYGLIGLLDEDLEKKPVPQWEQKKQEVLEYYNTVKGWAKNPKARTSCYCNIGIDTLNEWLGENDNDN